METIKKNIKAIIFDMDGTIVQTDHVWFDATVTLLEQHGIQNLSPKQLTFLKKMGGMGLTPCAEAMKKEFSLQASVEQLVTETKNLASEAFENHVSFIEGFPVFHKKLSKNGLRTSIATNADQKSLSTLSGILKFDSFFGSHLYCVDHVGKPKPDPALFLHAAYKLDVSPSECIVFEDSIFGFRAAKAAGMRCVGVKNSQNQHLLAEHTNASFETYYEAEEALRSAIR